MHGLEPCLQCQSTDEKHSCSNSSAERTEVADAESDETPVDSDGYGNLASSRRDVVNKIGQHHCYVEL
jgi:hypothetical protein